MKRLILVVLLATMFAAITYGAHWLSSDLNGSVVKEQDR